ncbi:hypothetical protein GGX14DRAFT_592539 [Mycena pura]|uniref:Uncharacterized protein n=1 Tax=Mycena pura TaxID=153505 RepID=A0AAD6VQ44_9AGAR|nr:hypothetical protein GGX14DRAFT_592539 [Mycena pura]
MAPNLPPLNVDILERRNTPLKRLQQAMGPDWDDELFEEFREAIRNHARRLGLERLKTKEKQDAQKWNMFIEALLKCDRFPALANYADHWPVTAYFNRWVYDLQASQRRQPAQPSKDVPVTEKQQDSDPDSDSGSSDIPLSRRVKEVASTRVSKRTRTSAVEDDAETAPGNPPAKRATTSGKSEITYIGKNPSNFPRPRAGSSPAQPKIGPACRDRLTVASSSGEEARTIEWPQWCVFCGQAPIVPKHCTEDMRKQFQDDIAALGIFQSLGILHDLHFQVFASLSKDKQRDFLASFVRIKFNQVKASQFFNVIDKYAAEHAGDGFSAGEITVCLRHQDEYAVDVPSELAAVLHAKGMEELGPAAVFAGITSNDEFRQVLDFKADAKNMFLGCMTGIVLSPFQKLMFEVVITPQ